MEQGPGTRLRVRSVQRFALVGAAVLTGSVTVTGLAHPPPGGAHRHVHAVLAAQTFTGNFNCSNTFPPPDSTVTGNLTVPSGVTCTLTDVTVGGNVTVSSGGTLIAHGGSVKGNVGASGAAGILFDQLSSSSCQSSPVTVGYQVQYSSSSQGFVVAAVNLSSLDTACDGAYVSASLMQGTTTVANGGPVTITGSTASIPMTPQPLASVVDGVGMSINSSSGGAGAGISIGGDLTISNSGGIRITGATVANDIYISGTTGSSQGSPNFVCASSDTGGNFTLQTGTVAAAFSIGGTPSCGSGNTVAKNMTIQSNLGPVTVSNNTIGRSLSCSRNASITGSGNTAKKKTGQCAGFWGLSHKRCNRSC